MSTAIQTHPSLEDETNGLPADAGRRLNYRHLAAVHAVARAGSLTKAATALQLAPPTLSVQIRDFEKSLGVKLFRRVRGGLRPTESGEIAIAYASRIFATGCELLDELASFSERKEASPVVGLASPHPTPDAPRSDDEVVDAEPMVHGSEPTRPVLEALSEAPI